MIFSFLYCYPGCNIWCHYDDHRRWWVLTLVNIHFHPIIEYEKLININDKHRYRVYSDNFHEFCWICIFSGTIQENSESYQVIRAKDVSRLNSNVVPRKEDSRRHEEATLESGVHLVVARTRPSPGDHLSASHFYVGSQPPLRCNLIRYNRSV